LTDLYSLHLIFSIDGWDKAQSLVAENDRVVFLQDAVYLLQKPLKTNNDLIYGRYIDCNARNLTPYVGYETIDDEQWLELSEHANNILSW